jgi:phosphoribosylaminoimidazole-succinocarboxamide synthase
VTNISNRYKELYLQVRGESLPLVDYQLIDQRIEQKIIDSINSANLETKKN